LLKITAEQEKSVGKKSVVDEVPWTVAEMPAALLFWNSNPELLPVF
jgi:hypothetical protein